MGWLLCDSFALCIAVGDAHGIPVTPYLHHNTQRPCVVINCLVVIAILVIAAAKVVVCECGVGMGRAQGVKHDR